MIPHYAQQPREHVQPDMITLGSLSLQQVSATKRNICVIIPYSPAHQPCPLCRVSLAFSNGHNVHMHVYSALCVLISDVLFTFCPISLSSSILLRHDIQILDITKYLHWFYLHMCNTELIVYPVCILNFVVHYYWGRSKAFSFSLFKKNRAWLVLISPEVHGEIVN